VKAHLHYLRYLVRHKWFVLQAGLKTGAPLWRLLIHDWSKFLPVEWRAYVRTFYGPFQVGSQVEIDSWEGVHGAARIVGQRQSAGGRFEVEMLDGSQRFWAWDHEVGGLCDALNAFDIAWLHHQHYNPHHWQHWILRLDDGGAHALEMPEEFVREMVADWAGAGRAITGAWEVLGWYKRNSCKMELHPRTRRLVEELLDWHFCSAEARDSEAAHA
jgi:hypothetical protein